MRFRSKNLFGLVVAALLAAAMFSPTAHANSDKKGQQIRVGPLLNGAEYEDTTQQADAYFFYTSGSADVTVSIATTVINPVSATCTAYELNRSKPSIVDDAGQPVTATETTVPPSTIEYSFHSPTDIRPAPWTEARRFGIYVPQVDCGGLNSYTLRVDATPLLTAVKPLTRGDVTSCTDRQDVTAHARDDVMRWRRIVKRHKPQVIKGGHTNKWYLKFARRELKRMQRLEQRKCTPLIKQVIAQDAFYEQFR